MKKLLLTLTIGLGILTANAQIQKLAGPRIGFTVLTYGSSSDFINDRAENEKGVYIEGQRMAFISQYGWQWESRFADGGEVTGVVEWIALVGGMEKGLFLPSVSSLVGLRSGSGYEFAAGPNLSLSGIGMVISTGYNFTFGNLNVPVNLAFVPGKSGAWGGDDPTGSRVSIMVGFNMNK